MARSGDHHGVNRRTTAFGALVAAFVLLLAGPAGAHVEVGPGSAVAGTETTLTFSFHHGKDGAATTGLEVRLPEGASVVEVPAVEGWTSSVSDDQVVTWTGGRVPDGTEAEFPVVVLLPPDAGVALFPTVQTTEAGELAWISPDEGEAEGQYPAPRVELSANPNPSTSTTTSTTAGGGTRDLPRTVGEAEQLDDGNNDSAPWLIGSGIAALVVILGGGLLLKRRAG